MEFFFQVKETHITLQQEVTTLVSQLQAVYFYKNIYLFWTYFICVNLFL